MAETNSVKDDRLEAGTLHAESPETLEAWGLYADQQCKDEFTDEYVQFISSTHCKPLKVYENFPNLGDVDTEIISARDVDEELIYIDQGRKSGGMMLWVGICLALATLTVCIIALTAILSK